MAKSNKKESNKKESNKKESNKKKVISKNETDDYTEKLVTVSNLFLVYYKKEYGKNNAKWCDGVSDEDIYEKWKEMMTEYSSSNTHYCDRYVDEKILREKLSAKNVYHLKVNKELKYTSTSLFLLLIKLSDIENCEKESHLKWSIKMKI